MKIDLGVQGILRFCLSCLNDFNVGITDGKETRSIPLSWAQVA
jgi:hypothetical protein